MLGHDLVVQADHDPVGVSAHLHRPPCRLGHDRVAVAVEVYEAGAGHRVRRLVEAVERRQHRLERRTFGVPCLGDGQLLLIGVLVQRRPPAALRLQPPVQLLQAGEA